jgi:hypothetical protein
MKGASEVRAPSATDAAPPPRRRRRMHARAKQLPMTSVCPPVAAACLGSDMA